jgi:hypothetical protein
VKRCHDTVELIEYRIVELRLEPAPDSRQLVIEVLQLCQGQALREATLQVHLNGMVEQIAGDRQETRERSEPTRDVVLRCGGEQQLVSACAHRPLLLPPGRFSL